MNDNYIRIIDIHGVARIVGIAPPAPAPPPPPTVELELRLVNKTSPMSFALDAEAMGLVAKSRRAL